MGVGPILDAPKAAADTKTIQVTGAIVSGARGQGEGKQPSYGGAVLGELKFRGNGGE